MKEFSTYLIISTLCLSFSYGIFKIVFNDESRFGQQRIFLLASLILSVLLPASGIRFEILSLHPAVSNSQGNLIFPTTTASNILQEDKGLLKSALEFLPYIYIIVSGFLIFTMIVQLLKILRLRIISEKCRQGNLLILRSKKIKSPFSFFTWIFIPATINGKEEIDSIIIHEDVHARNFHSIDNIISGLATALMWFNPVLWLMKSSLQLVHEYMADEGTLRAGIEKTRYQVLLVNQAAEEILICIPSTFNNNLKKRMIMMTKSTNKAQGRFRILSLLPVSVILIIAVAILNGLFVQDANAQQKEKKAKKDKAKEIMVTGYATKPDTMNYIVDGAVVDNIKNLNPDSIESIDVLKTDRTIVIRTKAFARKNAPAAKVQVGTGSDNVLYILDDRPISKDEMNKIEPTQIQSVNVIKGKDQIKKYTQGDYDGVVIITSKK